MHMSESRMGSGSIFILQTPELLILDPCGFALYPSENPFFLSFIYFFLLCCLMVSFSLPFHKLLYIAHVPVALG